MTSHSQPTRPIVAYSERLGHLTSTEKRLETECGADVRRVSLWTRDEIRENAGDADIVFVGSVEPFGAHALEELARARLIVRRGVGTDNIDLEAATALGIGVAYVPDASVEEVSDHALALLLALERRVSTLDRAVRGGVWARDASAMSSAREGMRRMRTLTLGIVGLGRIGHALARKSEAIYGTVLGHDPVVDRVDGANVEIVGFADLVSRSDSISLHAPLTNETRSLFDHGVLSQMKEGAYLVNTSRGGLVDERALVAALEAGHLGGAGLDVTEREPLPSESPLLAMPNVILTGHSAASGVTSNAELRAKTVDAAVAALQGRLPEGLANPEVLNGPASRLRTPT